LARSLPSSRHSHAAALIVTISMAAALTLLAFSSQSLAQARKGACPSSSPAHVRHVPRACAQSKRTSKPSHKGEAQARSRVKGHHVNHAAARKHAADGQPAKKTTKPPAAASQIPAICEEGSAPVRAGDGSFSCGDESEPTCEDGSEPTLTSDLTLRCNAPPGHYESVG
jgi:hypothetical protein